jgi:hypothetical protein
MSDATAIDGSREASGARIAPVHMALGLVTDDRLIVGAGSSFREADTEIARVGLALDLARGYAFVFDALLAGTEVLVDRLTIGGRDATAWHGVWIARSYGVTDACVLFASTRAAHCARHTAERRVLTSSAWIAGVGGAGIAVVAIHRFGHTRTTHVFAVARVVNGASVSIVAEDSAHYIAGTENVSVLFYVLGDRILGDIDGVPVAGITRWEMTDLHCGCGCGGGRCGQQRGYDKKSCCERTQHEFPGPKKHDRPGSFPHGSPSFSRRPLKSISSTLSSKTVGSGGPTRDTGVRRNAQGRLYVKVNATRAVHLA